MIIGQRLGPYEIVAKLGEGGMGEVYRATDNNLKRTVAIKVLPAAVAADPDRLARFQREAEVLAALNHPNIAAIYGLERGPDFTALIMELVDGEDLAHRIAEGPLPIDEALPIAKQIADALEAAHDQGIIHRDLKPANIKVRTDGTAKVLDFGLAKAIEPAVTGAGAKGTGYNVSMSPTLTSPAMTSAGMILGTAAYMAPEQAKGKTVDRRADIWAFGAVLYEMVTGKQAFTGDSVTEVLASVLAREPDWSALPANAATINGVIRRCLERDPRQRFGDMQSVRLALSGALLTAVAAPAVAAAPEPASVDAGSSRKSRSPRSAADKWASRAFIVAVIAIIFLGRSYLTRSAGDQAVRHPIRLAVDLPSDAMLSTNPALSPDGRVLVYGLIRNGKQQLYRRPLDQFTATPIAGTEGGDKPFFSPDGQWIGFFAGGSMKKIPAGGGEPIILTKSASAAASWGTNDEIVFSAESFGATIRRVSAAGGEATTLTTPDVAQGEATHQAPEMLPGARGMLFHTVPAGKIFVRPLPDGAPKALIDGTYPRYVPTGHIAFVRDRSLWAVPFNLEKLEITGPPVRLAEGILSTPTVANDGTLAYASGVPPSVQLVWVTRDGHEEPANLDADEFNDVALSPDGKRVVVSRGSLQNSLEMMVGDFSRRTLTKLPAPGVNTFPLWTSDGRSIVYSSTIQGGRNIFRIAADGTSAPERLTNSANQQSPWTWSKDGGTLLLNELRGNNELRGGAGGYHLVAVPASGGKEQVVVEEADSDRTPAISPDGRWIAYQAQADDATPPQIIVRPYPNASSGRWQVSTDGGIEPKWSADGRELFYRGRDGAVMRVATSGDPGAWRPAKLFDSVFMASTGAKSWDVAPDGRFLMKKGIAPHYSLNVVLNWSDELKRLVPAK